MKNRLTRSSRSQRGYTNSFVLIAESLNVKSETSDKAVLDVERQTRKMTAVVSRNRPLLRDI